MTTDADAGRVAAEKLMRAGSVFESAEDVPPVNPEDLSLLERVGERFESFKLELAGAAAARGNAGEEEKDCLLYTSPSPRDKRQSRMPSSA